jgi:glutathione peroxidase-family protein
MKKIIFYFSLIALVACQRTPMFTVEGVVVNAAGQMLYLEHTALLTTSAVDSVELDESGQFTLRADAPQSPDFYRLRIGSRSLPLAIDSIETVQITTSYDSLSHTLNIEGSEASLLMAQLRATARVATREELRQQAQQLIMQNPRSLAAYYAVFLKQNGEYIWNLLDASDRRMYQVVATSFQTWMPDHERTKILCNQVKEVIRAERSLQSQQAVHQLIADSENAFLDIELPDEMGQMQSLSQFRGKVVVLDFSSAEMQQAIAYTFELRELYNQYHKRGLEIYSVSLNRNRLAWQDAAANLPWTTVQLDENTATSVLMRYNVQALPTIFLLDKKGNVQGRYADFATLEADIRKYL